MFRLCHNTQNHMFKVKSHTKTKCNKKTNLTISLKLAKKIENFGSTDIFIIK